jgi:hypothetical protein
MHPIKKNYLHYISCASRASMLQKMSAVHQETIKLLNRCEIFLYLFLFGTKLAFLSRFTNPGRTRIIRMQSRYRSRSATLLFR